MEKTMDWMQCRSQCPTAFRSKSNHTTSSPWKHRCVCVPVDAWARGARGQPLCHSLSASHLEFSDQSLVGLRLTLEPRYSPLPSPKCWGYKCAPVQPDALMQALRIQHWSSHLHLRAFYWLSQWLQSICFLGVDFVLTVRSPATQHAN